jgi:sulfur relay (sulfurtransferase) complex TusBCD TusD component (DsrE family)
MIMATTKLAFIVQRPGYKSENPKLAFTHAISSQTVEIYLEDGDMVEPMVALVGEGVLNVKAGQKGLERYGLTSTEGHVVNSLLCDVKIRVCREDMERYGMTEADLPDAEAMGADEKVEMVSWDEIVKEMDSCNHLLFF